ncbi:MAG: hypothetical protein KME57_18265 [Scytonema hyalinum WJT4-NPBG1]|jgi:hypothetical protein|nr:hypothetical protein [Scytonema hyalinum WJT4-NPBG1]
MTIVSAIGRYDGEQPIADAISFVGTVRTYAKIAKKFNLSNRQDAKNAKISLRLSVLA